MDNAIIYFCLDLQFKFAICMTRLFSCMHDLSFLLLLADLFDVLL